MTPFTAQANRKISKNSALPDGGAAVTYTLFFNDGIIQQFNKSFDAVGDKIRFFKAVWIIRNHKPHFMICTAPIEFCTAAVICKRIPVSRDIFIHRFFPVMISNEFKVGFCIT